MTTRPDRVPADELRQRMLDAGRELALEAGAALTIEHLRLEQVIQRAGVPRSSAYRAWPYKEDYIDDLLSYLAGAGGWFSGRPVLAPETFRAVKQVLADNSALLASPEGRRALLLEVVRVTSAANYHMLSDSGPWRLHMALVATLGSTRSGAARTKIAAALEDAQATSRDSLVAMFGFLATRIGLRMRDPARTVEHLQLAGGLLVQALALRNTQVRAATGDAEGSPRPAGAAADGRRTADSHGGAGANGGPAAARHVDGLLNAPLPGPGLHGEPAPWTLAAFAYLGVLDAFAELDPDFVPPAPAGVLAGAPSSAPLPADRT
jgi:AcrR family transcriptional regulator